MKNVILATTLIAMASTFAAPSFAMDNPVNESRAKIDRILAKQKAQSTVPATQSQRAVTLSVQKPPVTLDRYEAARERLFGDRAGPAGR